MKTWSNAIWVWVACLGIVAAAFPAGRLGADEPATKPAETPRQIIDRLSKEVIGILTNKGLTTNQKQEKIQAIAFANIDFPVVSRLSLGLEWRRINDAQRADFMKEYRAHMANTYRHMIDSYTDEQVQTVGEREEERGDRTVLTKVIDPQKPDDSFKVNYRVRHEKDGWKIIDITVEGVSLVDNFREQFQDIVSNQGFDGLMKMLREKNAEADRDAAKNPKGAPATQGSP